jgi:hypothetical protein
LGEAARHRRETARNALEEDGRGQRVARQSSLDEAQPPRPRRGLARRLGARQGVLRVAARERRRLRLYPPARAGSHQRLGSRSEHDGRRVPHPLPPAPGRLGAAPFRR